MPQITSIGPKCFSGGIVTPSTRRAGGDQQLARVAQVAGQEDDDRDLRELRRLHAQRADLDRQVGAVGRRERARQQQQQDAADGDQVAVALEHAVVAQQHDRRGEQPQADDEPLRLQARQAVVDPVDLDQAEARQQRHEREQVRVGVRQRQAQHEVRRDAQAEEDRAVGQRDVGDLVACRSGRRAASSRDRKTAAKPADDQQRGGDQREELAVAGAHLDGLAGEVAALDLADEVDGVVVGAQLVLGDRRAAPAATASARARR